MKRLVAFSLLCAAPAFAQSTDPTPKTVDFLYQQIVKAESAGTSDQSRLLYKLIDATLAAPKVMAEVRNQAGIGNAHAEDVLGNVYQAAWGRMPQDYAQAVSWFRKAAIQGDADAQYNLGSMYATGQGVSQDDAQAASWYQKAASQGNASAQYNLGIMYENGQGVPQDYAQAASWYQKAASQGNALAQLNLGFLYFKGLGVPQNSADAERLFKLSAAQGNQQAARNLRILQTGSAQ